MPKAKRKSQKKAVRVLKNELSDPSSSRDAYFNRELSWLNFAERVLALVEDPELPLLERIKFAGIMGMLHSEFFMKRVSGLKRQMKTSPSKLSIDGRTPREELELCRKKIQVQVRRLSRVIKKELRPGLQVAGIPIQDYLDLEREQQEGLREYFLKSVLPILTPLAVDPEHPFPFISNLGLNLGVLMPDTPGGRHRFIRIKVPSNRPRWVPLRNGSGFVPLEQVIAANLDLLYPKTPVERIHFFQVTRGAEGDVDQTGEDDIVDQRPGSIIQQVSHELKARRFAGVVRLQVEASMPDQMQNWLARQLMIEKADVYPTDYFLGLSDLLDLNIRNREKLSYPSHEPVPHPRLKSLDPASPDAVFREISSGDVLLHHPYHSFDTSVLRFLESAAGDPAVLAIKLTIYRTSKDSPIVRALAEAVRRNKQVAVIVEITARFDEAPNIAWGRFLEQEGAHVAYGVERLKTHVKLALVVREEQEGIRRYAHVGTGNYHTGTAKIYEDLGILTCHPQVCEDVAAVFNALTGTTPYSNLSKMLVAPVSMRERFTDLIRREAMHSRAGRPSGIYAKMNQLQDAEIIRELYAASREGVSITLNIRGLCCLRPGVPGLSENIRVYGVVGRFLEHSRVYRFVNGGEFEYYLGSADWMRRNLDKRVETIVPVLDPTLKRELDQIVEIYEKDNASAWDCRPDGTYVQRKPPADEERFAAQEMFIRRAEEDIRSNGFRTVAPSD